MEENNWLNKLTKGAEYVAGGFHAVPLKNVNPLKSLPSMHRLLNVVGMVAGFAGAKYIADTIFGQKINGSQYQKIPREKIFPPLRFLHGIVHYNPFSDEPRDQWLKILHQMIPAAGGAFGAIKGSEFFFKGYNGAEKTIQTILDKPGKLHPLDAEQAITFEQGKMWRIGAGLSAWMGSVTGLTGILYGWTLNSAFLLCNQAKSFTGLDVPLLRKFSNNQYDSNRGPAKALPRLVNQFEIFVRKAKDTGNYGEAADEFGKKVAGGVVFPFFRKLSEGEKKTIVGRIQTMFDKAYQDFEKSNPKLDEKITAAVAEEMKKTKGADAELLKREFKAKFVKEEMEGKIKGLLVDPEIQKMGDGMVAGNNGFLGKVAEFFDRGGKIKAMRERMVQPPQFDLGARV